ncbi:hypothetical protein KIPB_003901 [Kipferlia bialata]|uniref:Uncharacterized protein n=1 Tax=Kipferlia bialata TaxID=797122 RepID=A0A391NKW8_9EUKA|nr:hypothetical protein KIPB_003901 [Kipferlia bialata]|eukprot:g3901.t1
MESLPHIPFYPECVCCERGCLSRVPQDVRPGLMETYDMCLGTCPTGPGYCIEVAPQECACTKCGFDLASETCLGWCQYPTACLLVANATCTCTQCGWASKDMDLCAGFCGKGSGSVCMQPDRDSGCTCTDYNQCIYDYATESCLGLCGDGFDCIESQPTVCTCAESPDSY